MVRLTVAFLVLIAGILAFAARRGTLHDLRAANESLRRKIEVGRPPVAPRADKPSAEVDQLSEEERAELLRLRGQIRPLQQEIGDLSNHVELVTRLPSVDQTRMAQTNLQHKLTEEQRASIRASQAFSQSPPIQALYAKATSLGQKLQGYLHENNGQLPQDLTAFGEGSLVT